MALGRRGLGLVPFTGTYDPNIDAGEGYAVDGSSYGAFDAAKSAYQIAQLQAAGATNIQYNPYTRQYVDADKVKIYDDTGHMDPSNFTEADQAALDTRIQTVLNDPNSTAAAKALVSLPGYGTPSFDASLNNGTNPTLATHVNTLLSQSAAQAVPVGSSAGELYLVGGQYFHTMADAQKAQAQLDAAGVTLLSQIPGAASDAAAGGVFDLGAGGGGAGGTGGASASSSFPLPVLGLAAVGALLLLGSRRKR